MTHLQTTLRLRAPRQGLHEITADVRAWAERQSVATGLLTLFIRHTSASLVIQENVDPAVQNDLTAFFDAVVPEDDSRYTHVAEGPDDMPAHIKGALTQTQLAVPMRDHRLLLGRYQGIFLFEHRRMPREREIALHLAGEPG